jgi:hypothetical protein
MNGHDQPGRNQAPAPADPVTAIDRPQHPVHALTTYELTDYRRQLETALAYLDKQDPVPAVRAHLQAALDGVIAEQDDRKRLARA